MVGACSLYALTSLLAKTLGLGVQGPPLHPLQVSAGRFFFAFLALSAFSLFHPPPLKGALWSLHAGRSICGWIAVTLMFAAAARMPLAEATAISFLSPIVTMTLAIPLLAERVGPIRWFAAGISMAGGIILIRPGTEAFQPAALLALGSALLMGLEIIFIKKLSSVEPPLRILLINNAIGALISVTAAFFVWIMPSPTQFGLLALLGVSMACGQSLFIQSMRNAEASFVIPFSYSTLIFATIYDFTLFGEFPDALSQLGALVIVLGAILLAWRENMVRKRHSNLS